MNRVFCLLFIFSFPLCAIAKTFLFQNNKSTYTIVVPSNASMSERTAAEELQSYIKQISGATLPILEKQPESGNYIFIGYNKIASNTKPSAASDEYTYKTIDGNLYVWGNSQRGTMYGVFSFLENELGVRWYTSDYTKVPKLSSFALPSLNHTEKPSIKHRLDFYYMPLKDDAWCAHNKINDRNGAITGKYGERSAYYGIHTMYNLVSPDVYFKDHPEYYCMRNGKRQSKDGQLCLTNKAVLEIAVKSILQIIKDNPGYWVYDVSQMDNENYCQCENCSRVALCYGGQSGLMIWFVNQVASRVKKVYPDKMIGTFAYHYTRHVPTNIKPYSNVVIRLCDIECCFHHPLSSSECVKNKDFMEDLKQWSKLTQNIYIWDYATNFYSYLMPYPNFSTIGANVKTFATYNVVGIMEEGAYDAPWAEFSELRQWLIAKLLWNPSQDTDDLVRMFCADYYGDASAEVYGYYKLLQDIPDDCHVIFSTNYYKSYYENGFIRRANELLSSALARVKGDTTMTKRVNRVIAQLYYLQISFDPSEAKKNGTYSKLKAILWSDPTCPRESYTDLDETLNSLGFM